MQRSKRIERLVKANRRLKSYSVDHCEHTHIILLAKKFSVMNYDDFLTHAIVTQSVPEAVELINQVEPCECFSCKPEKPVQPKTNEVTQMTNDQQIDETEAAEQFNERIMLRLSTSELSTWKYTAKQFKMSLSAFIRLVVNQYGDALMEAESKRKDK